MMPGSHPRESHLIGFGYGLGIGIYKNNTILLGIEVYDGSCCDLGGKVICFCVPKVLSQGQIIEGWIKIDSFY